MSEYDALNQLSEVIYSDWTGDYFFDELPDGRFSAIEGYEPDAELYDAITRMIENWEQVELPEISAIEYRRPR